MIYTRQHFPNSDLVYEKGVYCYEYVTGPEVFEETQLPSVDKFYSALNEEIISSDDYKQAQKMRTSFSCNKPTRLSQIIPDS